MTVNAAEMQFNSNTAAVELLATDIIILLHYSGWLSCTKHFIISRQNAAEMERERERQRFRCNQRNETEIAAIENEETFGYRTKKIIMQCTSRSQYNHNIFLFSRKNRMEQRGEKVPIVRRCTCKKNNNYSDREYRHKYNQSARRIYRKELLSSACIARCFLQQKRASLSPLSPPLQSNTYCCCCY